MKKKLFLFTTLLILASCGGGNDNSSHNSSEVLSYESSFSNNDSKNSDNSSNVFSSEVSISEIASSSSFSKETSSNETSISSEVSSSELSSSELSSSELSSSELSSSELSSSELSSSESISSSNSSSSASSSDDPIGVLLETPQLKIDNEIGVVSWDEVSSATHYNYIINDGDINSTTSTTIALNNKSNISVQAASNDGVSDWSDAITFFDTSDVYLDTSSGSVNVYFHGTDLSSVTINKGETVTKPSDPSKIGYTFDNWYEDPFHEKVFDFNEPIYESTIIYASYNKTTLTDDVYFYMKANDKITNVNQYTPTGWKFIPLIRNNKQTEFIEFSATITVSGASTSDPAAFVITDGFGASEGRNYWKNNGKDFSITSDGIYNIYFSAEHEYQKGINASINVTSNTSTNSVSSLLKKSLETPVVTVDEVNNIARWENVANASSYEVILNNMTPTTTTNNFAHLEKRTHISVRALNENDEVSSWSIPKANINYVYNNDSRTTAFVYFLDSDSNAIEVNINSSINAPSDPVNSNATFDGWYKDINCTTPVSFPYVVTENTVFYPKWIYDDDILTKDYYLLTDASGNKVCSLTWNTDNYDFYEYETPTVVLTSNVEYYVYTLDMKESWGPYTVKTNGSYKIYFSEEYVWGVGTEKARHTYFQYMTCTVYFSSPTSWDNAYAYMWNSNVDDSYKVAWPGEEMTYVKTNSYGQKQYKIEVDTSLYDYIIFNNSKGEQTCNISLSSAYDGIGYYISDGSYGTFKFE